MRVIGLTGGIASGKSVIASRIAQAGIAVLDADRLVHDAIAPGGIAEEKVKLLFPDAVVEGVIDRKHLGAIVFADPEKLALLEGVLHPLVRQVEEAFIAEQRERGAKAVLLEIPLLFETGADRLCDHIIAATAPEETRIRRAMHRTNMTEAKLEFIMAKQLPDADRNARADTVIDTGRDLDHTYQQVDALLGKLGLVAVSLEP